MNKTVNYNDIELVAASLADYPIIQNMARFYAYDMSEFMFDVEGWEFPEDGLYESIDFKYYWETGNTFPFLIRYQKELVGFVIVDKKGSDEEIEFNMAQFCILRKFKGKGIGKFVAFQCFDTFKGIWEVMVIQGNQGAHAFWKTIITQYTQNNFSEYTKAVKHFNNTEQDIFRFESGRESE